MQLLSDLLTAPTMESKWSATQQKGKVNGASPLTRADDETDQDHSSRGDESRLAHHDHDQATKENHREGTEADGDDGCEVDNCGVGPNGVEGVDEGEEDDDGDDDDDDEEEDEEEDEDDDDDDDGEEECSYDDGFSDSSTLTSMPSLAVIPKGRMARYAPPQFHVLRRGTSRQPDHLLGNGKCPEDGDDSDDVPQNQENEDRRSRGHPRDKYDCPDPNHRTRESRRMVPLRARLAPVTHPAVAMRRPRAFPTILNPTSCDGSYGTRTPAAAPAPASGTAWWETPLDALLGYPPLPETRVWDPNYEYVSDNGDDGRNGKGGVHDGEVQGVGRAPGLAPGEASI